MNIATLVRDPANPYTPTGDNVALSLHLLGGTIADVARKLDQAGARGERHDCMTCPVARFLTERHEVPFSVNYELATWYEPATGRWRDVALPAPVAGFVLAFDNGHWARLNAGGRA